MTTRLDILQLLNRAPVRGGLDEVLKEAIKLITHSALCEVGRGESMLPAAHYAKIYQRRASNPNPAVKAIPGLLLSLENFAGETGNLELISCALDSGSVALWFSAEGELVGCMLLAFNNN